MKQEIEALNTSLSNRSHWHSQWQLALANFDAALPLPPQLLKEDADGAYLQVIQPLLQQGLRQLETGLQTISVQHSKLPFDAQSIPALLFANLIRQVGSMVSRTVVLELNVAHLRGYVSGNTTDELLRSYVQHLQQPHNLLAFLQEYNVLACQLVAIVEQWVSYSLEFLRHLCTDWQALQRVFAPAGDPGALTEITTKPANTFQRGQMVLFLTFASGWQLVYKPESLAVDVHFQHVLTWLNEHGQQPPLRPLTLLDRGTYGWSEFVIASPCQSESEVTRLYQRQGSYLALLYVLGAINIQTNNLILAGEHAMLVDAGMLFQPQIDNPDVLRHPTRQAFNQSVLGTGLLSDDLSPDYCDYFITGFANTCGLLASEEFLETILPRFAHDEIRFAVRPTRTYIRLLAECFHPNHLRSIQQRDRYLDRLRVAARERPYLVQIVAAEQAYLRSGNIPLFTTSPEGRSLTTSQGESIANFFVESGLNVVRQRLRQLNAEHIARQIEIIRAAFTGIAMTARPVMTPMLSLQPARISPTRERLLRAACAIGERLCSLAWYMDDTASWLGMTAVMKGEAVKWALQPVGKDLYTGTAGIAFFLAYLGQITGEMRYTALSRSALNTVLIERERQKKLPQPDAIGAFNGLGSLIYFFTHLGCLWNDLALLQEAQKIVACLPDSIAQDEKLDILSGSAGCIMSLLALYAVTPSTATLATAIQCGEHLLARARPMKQGAGWTTFAGKLPLTGFAHGAAGIAYSLLALTEVSGQARFRDAALSALEYERGLFSPEEQNWPDLREVSDSGNLPTEQEFTYGHMWCYGASGIGLARLASLAYLDDAQIREEIGAALKTTIAKGFGHNHSLCHGDLGNLETLLVATQRLDERQYDQSFEQFTAMLLESVETGKWITGVPLGGETPGLMNGLAGIGYALLRLAEPEMVPSVLLLAPPVHSRRSPGDI
ncbi:hypothetical protein KSF_091540 [Reticulibacter mediterranei]|uniref:Lantibiotic biosynthesis protein dehydration domain-containing protein n=1 Tax=Reticulibacter mediterranei TaxID=2778369 RepID=A0A8J3J007_9CHLR|nr:type 2 lanthipeptide synthetase LanM family protein [Reticulibacter mediterranei]GHO99106.1 hypothetical protein KSF_091540 [Reticulibacter mediterranei]